MSLSRFQRFHLSAFFFLVRKQWTNNFASFFFFKEKEQTKRCHFVIFSHEFNFVAATNILHLLFFNYFQTAATTNWKIYADLSDFTVDINRASVIVRVLFFLLSLISYLMYVNSTRFRSFVSLLLFFWRRWKSSLSIHFFHHQNELCDCLCSQCFLCDDRTFFPRHHYSWWIHWYLELTLQFVFQFLYKHFVHSQSASLLRQNVTQSNWEGFQMRISLFIWCESVPLKWLKWTFAFSRLLQMLRKYANKMNQWDCHLSEINVLSRWKATQIAYIVQTRPKSFRFIDRLKSKTYQ